MSKTKIISFLAFFVILSWSITLPSVQAAETIQKPEAKKEKAGLAVEEEPARYREDPEENSSEALEMIALRMKSLSSSLNEMPKIPQLNQTIQLPLASSEEEDAGSQKENSEMAAKQD